MMFDYLGTKDLAYSGPAWRQLSKRFGDLVIKVFRTGRDPSGCWLDWRVNGWTSGELGPGRLRGI